MNNMDYWLNKIKKCKYPCFESKDDGVEECPRFKEEDVGSPDECLHLERGGTWEDCTSGALNRIYKEYVKTSKMPEDDGYYLVWDGSPSFFEGNPLGLACRNFGLMYWCPSGIDITEWSEGWQWSRILDKAKKEKNDDTR